MKINYRPEIDGLRAIAVLAVVFYHCQLGIPGGFVGVDVFFVISGYLITSIILADLDSGSFSLPAFWERRIRRILPASAFVILAVLGVGWFILLPWDVETLAKSAIAQSFYLGNFYFFQRGGYFDTGVESAPLLHTWSLAVEEQYYLLFPLLFLILRRRRTITVILLAIMVMSFAANILMTYSAQGAAYYLLPSRAWELMLGGLLAMGGRVRTYPKSILNVLGFTGAGLILYACLGFSKHTLFPGWAALAPCLGTALVIWACTGDQTLVGRWLKMRPLVFIGKISYSLYLWHWPIIVFAKYETAAHWWPYRLVWVLASILLASLTYYFVETPFRQRAVLTRRSRVLAFGACLPLFMATVGLVYINQGGVSRYPAAVVQYWNARTDFPYRLNISVAQVREGHLPFFGTSHSNEACLVWGDSHAMAILPAFNILAWENQCKVSAVTHQAALPVMNSVSQSQYGLHDQAKPWAEAVIKYVQDHQIKKVIMAGRWRTASKGLYHKQSRSPEEISRLLEDTVRRLQAAGATVWIMREVPSPNCDVPLALVNAVLKGEDIGQLGIAFTDHLESCESESAFLLPARNAGAKLLDSAPFFFPNRPRSLVEWEGHSLYMDSDHLTSRGARLLQPLFRGVFNRNQAQSDNN